MKFRLNLILPTLVTSILGQNAYSGGSINSDDPSDHSLSSGFRLDTSTSTSTSFETHHDISVASKFGTGMNHEIDQSFDSTINPSLNLDHGINLGVGSKFGLGLSDEDPMGFHNSHDDLLGLTLPHFDIDHHDTDFMDPFKFMDENEIGSKFPFQNDPFQQYKNKIKPKPRPSPQDFGKVIFSDDFNTLDHKKWNQARTASGGGNWEFQFYNDSRKTSFVKNGKLHIKPMTTSEYMGITDKQLMKKIKLDFITNDPKTNCTDDRFWGCFRETSDDNIINPTVSSQIRSINSFSFTYGKVDVVAKMPKGDWLWPAIWLMPKNENYGVWPASGEIDVVESRGNTDDCFGDGISTVSSALHWGLDYQSNRYNLTFGKYQLDNGDFSDGFHKFTLEWTPEYLRTWVDEKHLIMDVSFDESRYKLGNFTGKKNPWKGRGNNAPFDKEFYLIFNVAVGGTKGFFPDTRDPIKEKEIYDKCKPKYDDKFKPFNNTSPSAPKDFLLRRKQWEPTWGESDQSHMVIESVKVTEYRGDRGHR